MPKACVCLEADLAAPEIECILRRRPRYFMKNVLIQGDSRLEK
jgi:hypothetical protein